MTNWGLKTRPPTSTPLTFRCTQLLNLPLDKREEQPWTRVTSVGNPEVSVRRGRNCRGEEFQIAVLQLNVLYIVSPAFHRSSD